MSCASSRPPSAAGRASPPSGRSTTDGRSWPSPGSRRNPAAAGCNALLADGAQPLLDPTDVLVALGLTPGARRLWGTAHRGRGTARGRAATRPPFSRPSPARRPTPTSWPAAPGSTPARSPSPSKNSSPSATPPATAASSGRRDPSVLVPSELEVLAMVDRVDLLIAVIGISREHSRLIDSLWMAVSKKADREDLVRLEAQDGSIRFDQARGESRPAGGEVRRLRFDAGRVQARCTHPPAARTSATGDRLPTGRSGRLSSPSPRSGWPASCRRWSPGSRRRRSCRCRRSEPTSQ